MRIAIIRKRFTPYGGAEQTAFRLAHVLVRKDMDVHVIASEWDPGSDQAISFHRIETPPGPGSLGLKHFARRAAEIVQDQKFDLVHSFDRTYCQDVFQAEEGCHRAWLSRRAQSQGWWRARVDRINPRHRVFLDLEKKLVSDPRLKTILTNSRQTKKELVKLYGMSPNQIRVVYYGVDRQKFHPGLAEEHRLPLRRELGLEEDEPMALFVGTGFVRKGLTELIRAWSGIKARLVVVGGDRTGPFERLATKLGVRDRILFKGLTRNVARYYGAADVFVLPSWYDPFANVCIEALASGLPVVTTKGTGAAEVIEEGINGFTVGYPIKPDELGDRVVQAFELNRRHLTEANERILTTFTWARNLAETMEVYEDILD